MARSTTKKRPVCVLVTGATGFLGKVVVEELLRQRQSLQVDHVICLVRPKRGQAPQARFTEQMMPSPCFARLPNGWHKRVSVVAGELSKPHCGLSDEDRAMLTQKVTHIVHCAASVDFNRPVAEACTANIVSSLNVLELAKTCLNLVGMVSTSTAYVAVHRLSAIAEKLEPLPRPASAIFADILQGERTERELLAETGHPNTYTYTKCIAEHMLAEQRGSVPLSIVRPSIISASWQYPSRGWIDSKAAFAGFVATIGAGYLRLLDADPKTLLDLVPVDVVADRLITQVFTPQSSKAKGPAHVPIAYAVSGRDKAALVSDTYRAIVRFFRRNPTGRKPSIHYVGKRTKRYAFAEALHHKLPAAVVAQYFGIVGDERNKRRTLRMAATLKNINDIFPPFTHHTFDFVPTVPLPSDYDPKTYVDVVCQGVYAHLMGRDASEVPIGGGHFKARTPDLLWGVSRTQGSVAVRASAIAARKILRRVFDEITFDRESFDRATRLVGTQAQYVIVPTHRTYLDFLVCAYLFMARPDLGVALPHQAIAPRFFDRPILGALMRRVRTFSRVMKNEAGSKAAHLQMDRLIQSGKNVQFFIEGERSRTRQFMSPRIDMLDALKQTHRSLVILPVSISYDRVAEESPFLREMKGSARRSLSPTSLGQWAKRMLGHRVHLGRAHLRCGAPQMLNGLTDTAALGRDIIAELQANIVATTFHLQSFVEMYPEAGVSVAWLKRAIEQRGGTVLDSPLVDKVSKEASDKSSTARILDPILERSMRHHWQHHFFVDAQALAPQNVALAHYVASHNWATQTQTQPARESAADAKLETMLRVLFEPICRDYAAVATAAQGLRKQGNTATSTALIEQASFSDYATAQMGVQALLAGRLLTKARSRTTPAQMQIAPDAALGAYAMRCAWPKLGTATRRAQL